MQLDTFAFLANSSGVCQCARRRTYPKLTAVDIPVNRQGSQLSELCSLNSKAKTTEIVIQTFTQQNEHCDWLILGHVPLINLNVSRPGYNCAIVARTPLCFFVFAISKSKYITKHLMYGPSGNQLVLSSLGTKHQCIML